MQGRAAGDSKSWSWRNILNYTRTFVEKHNINVMLGQEMSHNRYENQYSTVTGCLSNSATDISAGNYDESRTIFTNIKVVGNDEAITGEMS